MSDVTVTETTEAEAKPLFERLLHGPKVRRILARVAEEVGTDAEEFLSLFEAAFEADGGRVRAPKDLSEEQILSLASMVRDRSKVTIDAALVACRVKSVATLNDLVARNALRIVSDAS